jgi:hypothetical protein
MIRRDASEALANAVVGLGVSFALVHALRALGLWDAPAAVISAVFFAASWGRGFALRRWFRGRE